MTERIRRWVRASLNGETTYRCVGCAKPYDEDRLNCPACGYPVRTSAAATGEGTGGAATDVSADPTDDATTADGRNPG